MIAAAVALWALFVWTVCLVIMLEHYSDRPGIVVAAGVAGALCPLAVLAGVEHHRDRALDEAQRRADEEARR